MNHVLRLFVISATLAFLTVGVRSTWGATFEVDRTDDDPAATGCSPAPNDCSLRGSITRANAEPGADTISVPSGIYTLTVAGIGEDANGTGDLDLTDQVALIGAGIDATIIEGCSDSLGNCNGVDRVIDSDPTGQGIVISISDLTARKGYPRNSNPSAHLDVGGGILNRGMLTLNGVALRDNEAANGGGIWSSGYLAVFDSFVTGNVASGSSGTGGGILARDVVEVERVTVDGNRAAFWGAGVTAYGDVAIKESTISNNIEESSIGFAGGLSVGGDAVVTRSTISGNSAGYGSGILAGSGTVSLSELTVVDNDGMGIYTHAAMPGVPVTTVEISSANIARNGTGILNGSGASMNVRSTSVSDNNTGVWNYGSISVTEAVIADNGGGGGFVNGGTRDDPQRPQATLRNVTISGNTSTGEGAGIWNLSDGDLSLVNVSVVGNSDSKSLGGGVQNWEGGSVSVRNTIIYGSTGGTDCTGTITSLGHNLDSDNTCQLTATGDLPGTDALVGPLGDNGGGTETHALLSGSPALDKGDNDACPPVDQRGYVRPADGDGDGVAICDIGAFEQGLGPGQSFWGDNQCDADVDAVDALQPLRSIAALPVVQKDGCQALGSIFMAGVKMLKFGDLDCDGDVDSVDALKGLRYVAALPVMQNEPCPDIGAVIVIVT